MPSFCIGVAGFDTVIRCGRSGAMAVGVRAMQSVPNGESERDVRRSRERAAATPIDQAVLSR